MNVLWSMSIYFLYARALPHDSAVGLQRLEPRHEEDRTIYAGEPPRDRTIFTVLSLFCIMVLSLLLGSRYSRLRRNVLDKRNITSMLVLFLYFLVLSFIFSAAVMLTGQGLYTYGLCFGATWICLLLYTAAKLIIYIFLVERVHVIRATFVSRNRDWLYMSCMAVMILSFGAVAVNAYLSPIIELKSSDGRCHMGIPGKASIPFMTVDIVVDAVLTGVFLYLLLPVVKINGIRTISGVFGAGKHKRPMTEQERKDTAMQRNIRILLWKSLIGSGLIMVPTVANMIQFYITGGRELALICLTLCVVDVSWDALVIHWLTLGSSEAERELTRSTQVSRDSPLTNRTSVASNEIREREIQSGTRSLLAEPRNVHTPQTLSNEISRNDTPTEFWTMQPKRGE